MKHFLRAVHDSRRHWAAITLATLCAVGVAALWSVNIGAVWPVIEMTLRGESTQQWLAERIAGTRATLAEVESGPPELDAGSGIATTTVSSDTGQPQERILESKRVQDMRRRLAWYAFLEPYVARLPRHPMPTICLIMGFVLVSTLVRHALMLANDLLVARVSTSIVRELRMRAFQRAIVMDRRIWSAYGTGAVLANITTVADDVANGLMALLGSAIREPLRILACLVGAALINWRLLLFSLLFAPALAFAVVELNRRLRKGAAAILTRNVGLHESLLDAIRNVVTIQAFTNEEREFERFGTVTRAIQQATERVVLFRGLSRPCAELVGVTMMMLTMCAGAHLVINKATHIGPVRLSDEPMTIAGLLVFFGLLVGASDPFRRLSGVAAAIQIGCLSANSLYQMLDYPDAVASPRHPVRVGHRRPGISLEGVRFHYDSTRPVLNDVSLEIPFGRTIGITGRNGAGKSTLVSLLCRFHDPVSGLIRLDGIPYPDLDVRDIRGRIGVVSPAADLFNRSVLDNIHYGRPDAGLDEVFAAARQAHADAFITMELAQGYATRVGDGGDRLSSGQRQRVSLARALLRQPQILILDEPTSHIDVRSEVLLCEALRSIRGTMTMIIISHRTAVLDLADECYELVDGRLVPPAGTGLRLSA